MALQTAASLEDAVHGADTYIQEKLNIDWQMFMSHPPPSYSLANGASQLIAYSTVEKEVPHRHASQTDHGLSLKDFSQFTVLPLSHRFEARRRSRRAYNGTN